MNAISIVRARLGATPDVTQLVKGSSIFPFEVPQGSVPPAVVINQVGDSDPLTLDGSSGYFDSRIRVESMALTPNAASAIHEVIRDTLRIVTKESIGGATDVDIAYITSLSDTSDDRSMSRFIADYSVRWRQR